MCFNEQVWILDNSDVVGAHQKKLNPFDCNGWRYSACYPMAHSHCIPVQLLPLMGVCHDWRQGVIAQLGSVAFLLATMRDKGSPCGISNIVYPN